MHDYHTHFIPQEVLNWLKENEEQLNAKWTKQDPKKHEFLTVNGKWGFELKPAFYNLQLYKEQQHAVGITFSMLSPIPQLFLYEMDDDITYKLATVYNEALSRIVKGNSPQFAAVGTVPLQQPTKAAIALREAMSIGLKGAIIGPGVAGEMLSDPYFSPFFEEANRLSAIIFIHPLLSEDPRIQQRMMPNLIGIPWETTVCATDLLLSGFLDQYPNIKILLAHGGGYLPYQLGRLDKGYEQWPAVQKQLQAPPSHYAKRFWYDSVLWDRTSIQFLIDTVGESQVVPGSDYPFDLCYLPSKTNQLTSSNLLFNSENQIIK